MIKAKKSLGQHFLTDNNIIRKIVHSIAATEEDRVVEIGPGTGAITGFLFERFSDFKAIEVDQRAIEVLNEQFPGIELIEQDVLKIDWAKLSKGKDQTHIVGNLPYYITSPILFGLFEARTHIKEAIVMMQKEVAERLVAVHSSKAYGILSVQTQLMSSVDILFHVAPGSFSPPPNVDSSVVRLVFDQPELSCSDHNLKRVVRTAFNQRRKKLSNALKPILQDHKPEGFNLDDRAEHWEPRVYEKLTEYLEKHDILPAS